MGFLDYVQNGLGAIDRYKQSNMAKQKAGTMWYDKLGQQFNSAVDRVKQLPSEAEQYAIQKAAEIEAFKQANLEKQKNGTMWYNGLGKYLR